MQRRASLKPGLFAIALLWRATWAAASPLLIDPASPRAMSLTRAFPMETGIQAIFSNPGGLAHVRNPSLGLTHTQLAADARMDALGLGLPMSRNGAWGTLGLSLLALTQDPLTGADESGAPTGSFAAWDAVVGLSYAKRLGLTQAGVTVKHLRQSIAGDSASGFALDAGLQRQLSSFLVALSVQNAGPRMRFVAQSYELPLTLNLGLTFSLNSAVRLHAAAQHRPHEKSFSFGTGAEMGLGQGVVLRSGFYNSVAASESRQSNPLSRLGFGMGWRVPGSRLSFDYALNPADSDLGLSHRLSMQLHWGAR